jgi:hypothetical protein
MPIGTAAFHERNFPPSAMFPTTGVVGIYFTSVYGSTSEHEYNAIRNAVMALIDITPQVQVPDHRTRRYQAGEPHHYALTSPKVASIYCCCGDEQGKVVDDGTITASTKTAIVLDSR